MVTNRARPPAAQPRPQPAAAAAPTSTPAGAAPDPYMFASLLDFPDDDDDQRAGHALSAEQLAEQLAIFSETQFTFAPDAPPPPPPTTTNANAPATNAATTTSQPPTTSAAATAASSSAASFLESLANTSFSFDPAPPPPPAPTPHQHQQHGAPNTTNANLVSSLIDFSPTDKSLQSSTTAPSNAAYHSGLFPFPTAAAAAPVPTAPPAAQATPAGLPPLFPYLPNPIAVPSIPGMPPMLYPPGAVAVTAQGAPPAQQAAIQQPFMYDPATGTHTPFAQPPLPTVDQTTQPQLQSHPLAMAWPTTAAAAAAATPAPHHHAFSLPGGVPPPTPAPAAPAAAPAAPMTPLIVGPNGATYMLQQTPAGHTVMVPVQIAHAPITAPAAVAQLKLELYLDGCGWTEQDKIRFVIGQLSGEAIAFWRRTAQPIPTTHWTEVINTLRTYFVPLTIGTDSYKALERLRQGNTPPFEFLKQFDGHASHVSNMSDPEGYWLQPVRPH
ncbi:hypothetical protein AMAG_19669 [Allomyces macrogynus ATCC 38327]|uniref:Retrotransposon gag domain-containing protein n=1 Tax=Allomyces macrogynus (strain ATCC 38327) TaxID=578462 RepID=A0A0L0SXW7_ALLM3|nr:hypothetical protein AMAG_19669 [Allomyces macrogynus ATCC 38327]|eukprot:KNE67240.1 hypothetical protein AMAG_19669 [Allomyces macrogynus ATCC 38327]